MLEMITFWAVLALGHIAWNIGEIEGNTKRIATALEKIADKK